METTERFFENYKGIIQKLAWKWAWKTGMEFEDFYSVGLESLVDSIEDFNPKKGSFSTFIYYRVNGAMQFHYKKNRPIPSDYYFETFKSVTPISEKLMGLSHGSREIVYNILENPDPLLRERGSQGKVNYFNFCKEMQKRGYQWQAAVAARKEIIEWLGGSK